jgi:multidrug efflux pump subunit AcrA (membrane-fusion protein)
VRIFPLCGSVESKRVNFAAGARGRILPLTITMAKVWTSNSRAAYLRSRAKSVITQPVEEIDRRLDELEQLARSRTETGDFIRQLLARLRWTLSSESATLLVPAQEADWLALASNTDVDSPATVVIPDAINSLEASSPLAATRAMSGQDEAGFWLAVPIDSEHIARGLLLVRQREKPSDATQAAFTEIALAYAEIAWIRQASELDEFVRKQWSSTLSLCRDLSRADTLQHAAMYLVNALTEQCDASRVSLAEQAVDASRRFWLRDPCPIVKAVSGVARVDGSSPTVLALAEFGRATLRAERPLLIRSPGAGTSDSPGNSPLDAQGLFHYRLGITLRSGSRTATALLLEFSGEDTLHRGVFRLSQLMPLVEGIWSQRQGWLRLPAIVRRLGQSYTRHHSWHRLARKVGLLALLGALVWALLRPYPLLVQADGIHEPASVQTVFVSLDGLVQDILVEDGQRVEKDQPLVQLRSPELELQLEQTRGQSRSLREEAHGLRIALSELNPNNSAEFVEQSRIAAKIAELELRQKGVEDQLEILLSQEKRLLLRAPISGQVNAKDLEQTLRGRPLRRGDALFNIVDLEGPWHVRVHVAERDAGYVLEHYFESGSNDAESDITPGDSRWQRPKRRAAIQYVLESDSSERYQAEVQWVADHVENSLQQGCYLEIRAGTDAAQHEQARPGAAVKAYFDCGRAPTWFVWCRPLIESLQRSPLLFNGIGS